MDPIFTFELLFIVKYHKIPLYMHFVFFFIKNWSYLFPNHYLNHTSIYIFYKFIYYINILKLRVSYI